MATSQNFTRISKKYGINSQSALMDLKYFNLCSGSLVSDVMHDVLEGVLQYEMKLLVKYCIAQKYFTASFLSSLMEVFELGFMESSNRPTVINTKILLKKDNSLTQNGKIIMFNQNNTVKHDIVIIIIYIVCIASQMWLLGRIAPLMLGHHVPKKDGCWLNMIGLLRIVELLLSPVDECLYLQILIQEHHEKFVQLYPTSSVTPKMHYMVHMPTIMIRFVLHVIQINLHVS